ncbi:MAG TPA: LPS export ABC transporter periplasmic protein LptC [Thermoanaerobaculia bacterium]|jgi:lipopolysaccharide transport protein LptA/LPS export ABC transporter protein LptC
MARKARSHVAGFRRLLLAALVLMVLALAGLFLFGRAGMKKEKPEQAKETNATKGMTLIGEDFDYTFTEGARPIFHIKGVSVKADREGTIYLEQVAITLWDRQGRIFHVESRNASFNRESNEGKLQGNVVLRGPDGLELRTALLNLEQKGNEVISEVPVEIHYGDKYVAHAGRMDVDLGAEVYTLQKGSRVESLPGVTPAVLLTSQRLIYDRQQRWLRVEGNASLRRGPDWLNARRIYGNLSPDEKSLIFVHGFWDIEGETHAASQPGSPAAGAAAPQPTTVHFSNGKDLAVLLQPTGNQVKRVELEGPDEGKVQMQTTGGGIARVLTAKRIEGELANGVLSTADALGGVEIRETSRPGGKLTLRQANGRRAAATFKPDGHLATVDLDNNVVYHDGPSITATGNRGSLDLEQGRGEFVGDPVVVTSDRGRVEAPRMVYNTDQQIVNARGGVRALLQKVEETALAGTPLAEGQGPVHVESQEAFWRQQPSSFIFRGDVRAWRGENLLLAPELKGDKAADQLTATGGVKTLWYPTQEQAAKTSGSAEGSKKGPAARPSPIQAAASDLQYQQKAGVLIYTGNVRVDQEGKTLTCQRMEVDLTADHQAKTMTCTGDTKLNDPKAGRRIDGQKAVYQVSQRQVEITGEPVVMNDRDGNQVRGKRVIYFVDTGRAVVQGKEDVVPAPITTTAPGKPAPAKPPGAVGR